MKSGKVKNELIDHPGVGLQTLQIQPLIMSVHSPAAGSPTDRWGALGAVVARIGSKVLGEEPGGLSEDLFAGFQGAFQTWIVFVGEERNC